MCCEVTTPRPFTVFQSLWTHHPSQCSSMTEIQQSTQVSPAHHVSRDGSARNCDSIAVRSIAFQPSLSLISFYEANRNLLLGPEKFNAILRGSRSMEGRDEGRVSKHQRVKLLRSSHRLKIAFIVSPTSKDSGMVRDIGNWSIRDDVGCSR